VEIMTLESTATTSLFILLHLIQEGRKKKRRRRKKNFEICMYNQKQIQNILMGPTCKSLTQAF